MYCNISVITLFTREFHYIYIVVCNFSCCSYADSFYKNSINIIITIK